MDNNLAERIIKHVSDPAYQPQRVRGLSRAMNITEEEYGDFRDTVRTLSKTGRLVRGNRNAVMPPESGDHLIGVYRANPRGFGFVVPDTPNVHGDLYIPEGQSLDAISGDRVLANVRRAGRRDGRLIHKGCIRQVLERGRNRFVGQLVCERRRWYVVPDGNALHVPIAVPDAGAKDARAGDQVVIELTHYPSATQDGRGVIVERLGVRGDPGVDTLSILRQYEIPDEFPEEVLAEARAAVAHSDVESTNDREDLSDLTVITIDPDDARDFDDAISLVRINDKQCELGIHIADVAAYVPLGGAVDVEARQRGNSVYLPRHVVPMLPEVLSNGLCSLQEDEPRLTKSVFIRYDATGRIRGRRFARTMIRSTKRLAYRQVTSILDGRTGGYAVEVVDLIGQMDELAHIIRARRLRDGMLVLDLPEAELVFDRDDNVIDVTPADTSFSHTIIEMFMVEANDAVAGLLADCHVPFLRRIHPDPDAAAAGNLNTFLRVFGHRLPAAMERSDLQRLLDSVRNRPESFAVNLAVLRSMQRAEYSPRDGGHFALASEHYTHFTSPIRRYPDLTIHRLLDGYLDGRLDDAVAASIDDIESLGRHCTSTEGRAQAAERELRMMKVLELLEQRVGEVESGVITGVANAGVFVQLTRYLVDGLIRLSELPNDRWDVDTRRGCAIGQRSGRRIAVGDEVKVRLLNVNQSARQLDLILVDDTPSPSAAKTKRPTTKAPRKPRLAATQREARRKKKPKASGAKKVKSKAKTKTKTKRRKSKKR